MTMQQWKYQGRCTIPSDKYPYIESWYTWERVDPHRPGEPHEYAWSTDKYREATLHNQPCKRTVDNLD